MFESRYKKAYDTVTPSQELVSDTINKMREAVTHGKMADEKFTGSVRSAKSGQNRFSHRTLKISLTAAAVILCIVAAVPVCAAHIPAFYKIVEYLSPAMADRLVPIEKSSTDQGITMQVEAINLDGNEAEIIISLRDAEGSTQDFVHGEMDLYDSFGLSDYTSDSIVGGCHFLTYDAQEDKAYFQVMVQSDHIYQSDKLQFSARAILCDKSSDTRDVDLSKVVCDAGTKKVTLSGSSGILSEEMLPDSLKKIPATEEDPRPGVNVLDMVSVADCAADGFTMTGIAYMDGVLRVQMCMGDTWNADRNVELFLRDPDGNERYPDRSVSWQDPEQTVRWDDTVRETSYHFYEFWYVEEIDNIADYSMYGIFHDSGEVIRGDWNVTFRLQ